ncbi:hypothetical protein V8G54_004716, partial [Vigna mungo]
SKPHSSSHATPSSSARSPSYSLITSSPSPTSSSSPAVPASLPSLPPKPSSSPTTHPPTSPSTTPPLNHPDLFSTPSLDVHGVQSLLDYSIFARLNGVVLLPIFSFVLPLLLCQGKNVPLGCKFTSLSSEKCSQNLG